MYAEQSVNSPIESAELTLGAGIMICSRRQSWQAHQMPRAKNMDPSLTMVGPATEGSNSSLNLCQGFFFCGKQQALNCSVLLTAGFKTAFWAAMVSK